MKERLQKLMAQADLGSRRACEVIIEAGRVRVNGTVAHLGDQADPDKDVIEVDGARLKLDQVKKIYIALNKPRNVVSTNIGHKGDARRTVRDLVPIPGHLFTIGRLDADSEGLIVLTNDGDLANRLSHPRYQHTRTYKVSVDGLPTAETIARWQSGVMLDEDEGMTAPCSVRISKGGQDVSILRIVMTEGKKRQIRRVAAILGHPVRRLMRIRIGLLELGPLQSGEWRELTPEEVRAMRTPSPELKEVRPRRPALRRQDSPSDERRRVPEDRRPSAGGPRSSTRPGDRPSSRPGSHPGSRPQRGRPSGGSSRGGQRPTSGSSRSGQRPARSNRSGGGRRGE